MSGAYPGFGVQPAAGWTAPAAASDVEPERAAAPEARAEVEEPAAAPGPDPVEPAVPAADAAAEREVVGGTGHPAVDAALESLVNAGNLAPGDQVAAYEAAHRTLHETLSTIDDG